MAPAVLSSHPAACMGNRSGLHCDTEQPGRRMDDNNKDSFFLLSSRCLLGFLLRFCETRLHANSDSISSRAHICCFFTTDTESIVIVSACWCLKLGF